MKKIIPVYGTCVYVGLVITKKKEKCWRVREVSIVKENGIYAIWLNAIEGMATFREICVALKRAVLEFWNSVFHLWIGHFLGDDLDLLSKQLSSQVGNGFSFVMCVVVVHVSESFDNSQAQSEIVAEGAMIGLLGFCVSELHLVHLVIQL